MPKKRYTAEEIIHKLREADVRLGQGGTIAQACKQLGIADQTYYRWRKGLRRHEGGPGQTAETTRG